MRKSSLLSILFVLSIFLLFLFLHPIHDSLVLAADNSSSDGENKGIWKILIPLATLFAGAVFGYFVGIFKSFREHKQQVYQEILSPILTAAYKKNKEKKDETALNNALSKLWLYASKDVCKKIYRAVSILIDRNRGKITPNLQEAIVAMRKDIQLPFFFWQRLKPEEVLHLYSYLSAETDNERLKIEELVKLGEMISSKD